MGELPETSTGGKMAMVVAPMRVVLVELKSLGYILDLEPIDLVHGLDGGVKKTEEAIQKVRKE